MASTRIRPATRADVPRLTEIYNHYVRETPITFDVQEWSVERRRSDWFEHYAETGRYRLLVVEEDGDPRGFASTSRFRPKAAYDPTVETTIYIDRTATGRGLGRLLYAELFESIRDEDIHTLLAGITLPNPASVALHESFGFQKVAHFTENGRKLGRLWDVIWLERRMENP